MPDIVTLGEAKRHLNISGFENDDELSGFVAAATGFFERWLGALASRTITETVTPTTDGLIFLTAPVISITSMSPAYGYPGTYAVANWTPAGRRIIAGYGLGTVYTSSPVTITYVGGYTTVPADLKQAALDYIKWRWMSQRGASRLPTMGDEFQIAPSATVPYKIMEVIDGYRQPVIA